MVKTPCGDYKIFAQNIILLLSNPKIYNKISNNALELVRNVWDWNKRSNKLYFKIFK